MKKVVLPGELVTKEDKRLGYGVKQEEDGIHSTLLGLLDERQNHVRIIPFSGGYDPKEVDFIVGVVCEMAGTFWRLDIASPYSAILPAGEFHRLLRGNEKLKDILPIGSTVYVKIKEVTKSKGVFTTMKWRGTKVLKDGYLLEISPSKIPRVIGKKDSMISILRKESGCEIIAGQNGVIWINGAAERIKLAIEALRYIEGHSHQSGLTDYIKNMIIEKRRSI